MDNMTYDKKLETLDSLVDLLDKSINPDAPLTLKEGSLIKDNYNGITDKYGCWEYLIKYLIEF